MLYKGSCHCGKVALSPSLQRQGPKTMMVPGPMLNTAGADYSARFGPSRNTTAAASNVAAPQ